MAPGIRLEDVDATVTTKTNGSNGLNGAKHDAERAPFTLGDFCIDDERPMKVVVIGAGYSGITAGIRCAWLAHAAACSFDGCVDVHDF